MTNGNGLSKVAGVAIEALKVNPLTLALIVLTAVFMYFVYAGVQSNRKDIHEIMKTVVERCLQK